MSNKSKSFLDLERADISGQIMTNHGEFGASFDNSMIRRQ